MIGVGVAGCGSIALVRHIPEYVANPNAKLIGVFDVVPERAEKVAQERSIVAYKSFADMLADPMIQAVSICTANRFHAEMTVDALNAGKHVLCEKPMATTVEEAQKMIDAAKVNQRFLMIGHNQRLYQGHVKAKAMLREGIIGRVLTFKSFFMHKGPEMWSIDRGQQTWFFDKRAASMGVMCDLGIHKIDLLRWILEDEFCEVSAMLGTLDKRDTNGNLIPVEDNAMCLLKTRNGIMGMLGASWTCYAGEENGTVIYGTEGIMRLNEDPLHTIVIQRLGEPTCYIDCGEMQTNERQTRSGVIDLFIQSILSGQEPEISGREGLEALKVVLACVQSSEKRCAVRIL